MKQTRRGFLGTVGGALAVTAGCAAPAADAGGQRGYEAVYERVIDSVALVRTYADGVDPADEPEGGQGSAFRYDDDHLLTNDHVVGDPSTIRVQYADGEWSEASVVGRDPYSDLAVLEPDTRPPGDTLDLLAEPPAIGTEVLAIGTPFGLRGSVTQGIVSGHNRSIPGPGDFTIADAVQTDAALNPGNSGGPIVDLDGNVVAVATAQVPLSDNLGFGVSSRMARRVVPDLVADGRHEHSYMGVGVLEVDPLIAEANDLPAARGVYVSAVEPGGPADGVLEGADGETTIEGTTVPTGGDVIVGFDDTGIDSQGELSQYLALETEPDDTLDVHLWRDGEETSEELTLGERPDPT